MNITISPNWNFLPFMGWLTELVGGAMALVYLLLLLAALVLLVIWVWGSQSGDPRKEEVGRKGLIIAVVAFLILGSIQAISNWAFNQDVVASPASHEVIYVTAGQEI